MAILSTFFTALIVAISIVHAHDESAQAVAKRQLHTHHARAAFSKCSHKLKARDLAERRLARRDELIGDHLAKREVFDFDPHWPNYTAAPCFLAPEVMVGAFSVYISSELIRKDISEGQPGIDLFLDFQFIDTKTCNPVPNVMVDIWHCNASSTGSYSGFKVEKTAGKSFNRGLQPTDKDGIMHMKTTFPGWYPGRATHIHLAAHTHGTIDSKKNIYKGGTTKHIGQIFFPEDILERVYAADFYTVNTHPRLTNDKDSIYEEEGVRYNSVAEVHYIGKSLKDGLWASITIGIDLNANHNDDLLGSGSGGRGDKPPLRKKYPYV
ncbi:aromatic compound dioxygenase [Wilcoxina mikolae CBS 423.85]|nr:aromatic compound dioxygenase [Wilcoxina mikolae CBS 423.85]